MAADPSYSWLHTSKQAVNRLVLFARLYVVLSSQLEHSVEQVRAVDPSARTVGAGRLLIATSMNYVQSPTNATITSRL